MIQKYRALFIPGTDPEQKYRLHYRSAYLTWYDVWNHTYDKELHIDLKPVTDTFTRQHEIIGLFKDDICAGLIALRWIDFSLINFGHDSYFKHWASTDIAKLTEFGPRVMTVTNMAVNPDYRKSKSGINFRDILLDLSARRFQVSSGDVIACVTRRERNVHRLFYEMGAVGLQQDIPHFHPEDRVDIVAIYRDKLIEHQDQEVLQMSQHLWDNRIYVKRDSELLTHSHQLLDLKRLNRNAA